MKAVFINDQHHTKAYEHSAVGMYTRAMFPEVLRWDELTPSDEPLFIGELSGVDLNSRLGFLAEYPGPTMTVLRMRGQRINFPFNAYRCVDHVLAVCPSNWEGSHRWYTMTSEFSPRPTTRDYTVVYVGRSDTYKKPSWTAAILERYPSRYILSERGISMMALYRLELPVEKSNPSRQVIENLLQRSLFAACLTTDGPGSYDNLENVMCEALTCGCAPILNRDWCTNLYQGYPAQVGSLAEARDLQLTTELRDRCLEFMFRIGEPARSCRTAPQLLGILHQTLERG